MTGYRKNLFANYNKRTDELDAPDEIKQRWFDAYVSRNYLPLLRFSSHNPALLDIGCSRGYLLSSLVKHGYNNVTGVDLSSLDIALAQKRLPQAKFFSQDGITFCLKSKQQYDVIIAKAVFEHIPKDQSISFLRALWHVCKPGGMVIIDVPNMDWLFASHERYMDFTHEVGFTTESLKQIMDSVFEKVQITEGVQPAPGIIWQTATLFARACVGLLLRAADPEGASTCIWARSIIGIGKKK